MGGAAGFWVSLPGWSRSWGRLSCPQGRLSAGSGAGFCLLRLCNHLLQMKARRAPLVNAELSSVFTTSLFGFQMANQQEAVEV